MLSAVTARTPDVQDYAPAARKTEPTPFRENLAAQAQAPTVVKAAKESGVTDASLLNGTASGIATPVDTSDPTNPATHSSGQNGANVATSQAPASDSIVGVSIYNSLGQINQVHPGSGHILAAAA